MADMRAYKVFKGLQKPLEFMGLKGRYVWYGLGGVLTTIVVFIILFIACGIGTAFIALIAIPSSVGYWIFKNMKKGLHSKKVNKGIHIITSIISQK